MNLRKMRFVAGAVAVATAFALATPASALPRAQETYDCDRDGYVYLYHAVPANQTLTVNFVSCEGLGVYVNEGSALMNGAVRLTPDSDWTDIPGDNTTITMSAGTEFWTEISEIDAYVAQEVADPSGSLLATSKAVFGRNPAE